MKLILKNSLFILAITFGLVSCTKNKEFLFNSPVALYVYYTDPTTDSTEFTFATVPVQIVTDTIKINYLIIGKSENKDREFKLVPREGATAKNGYHYKIGPTILKANQIQATVPVYVYRRAGLKDSTVSVILDIKENENFKNGYPDKQHFKITITDILKKPTIWDFEWKFYFGNYSDVKFRFLLAVTGRTEWNSYPFPGDSRFLSQKARNALLEYNQLHGPLIDEFGMEVVFP